MVHRLTCMPAEEREARKEMVFSVAFETRHTDTFAATDYVHAGVLFAFTELAYAEFERHCHVTKPDHVVSVERETHATFRAPLGWREGALVEVSTTEASARGFTQEFTVRSAASGSVIATFVHWWVWLDTRSGERVDIPTPAQRRLVAG